MLHSVQTLLANIVDYAGLFPPAKLELPAAVDNYARYLASEHSWMLGRFIVPVAKLEAFEKAIAPNGGQRAADCEPWRVSAIIGEQLDRDIDRIFAFNQKFAPPELEEHEPHGSGLETDEGPAAERGVRPESVAHAPDSLGLAVIETIEVKVSSSREVDAALRIIPEQLDPYFEIPCDIDPRGMIAALAGTGAKAKIRTGGVTPEAFPKPEHVARFIAACAAADVPFKATAGLHHPLRNEFPLTYDAGAPCASMYGFLNVFLAAAFFRSSLGPQGPTSFDQQDAVELLQERDFGAFTFANEGVIWKRRRLDSARIAQTRESFAISFGSCSFEEPVNELKALKLL